MPTVVVTEKALREMVREAMWNKEFAGWSSNAEGPAAVSSEVDPSIAVTDPVNPNFTPQNKTEFGVAVNQLVKNLPDDKMPGLFDTVKTAIDTDEEKEDEEDMDKKAAQGGTNQVEEAVRKVIRNVLADINPRWSTLKEAKPDPWANLPPVTGPLPPVKKIPAGVHGGEFNRRIEKNKADLAKGLGKAVATIDSPTTAADLGLDDDVAADAVDNVEDPANPTDPEVGDGVPDAPVSGDQVTPKRRAYKGTALGGMTDVGGASFEQIAKELGFSVAGAKQAVDKALEKAQFLGTQMDEDDREILVLTAMNDYIKMLSKGIGVEDGEEPLTAADIQLMKDHPDIVRELDGFREFLHNHIRRARKADQKLINPVKDDAAPESSMQGESRRRERPVLFLRSRGR